jgi:diketogulonate reductase-like aldo/keto reductase
VKKVTGTFFTQVLPFYDERAVALYAAFKRGVQRASPNPETILSDAQIAIAWLLDQEGVIVIPKAARAESQQANLDAIDIQLDDNDRAAIAALPKDQRFVRPPFAPDWDAVA